jgi:hypothetical protein
VLTNIIIITTIIITTLKVINVNQRWAGNPGMVRVFGRVLHSGMPLRFTPLLRLKRAGV